MQNAAAWAIYIISRSINIYSLTLANSNRQLLNFSEFRVSFHYSCNENILSLGLEVANDCENNCGGKITQLNFLLWPTQPSKK